MYLTIGRAGRPHVDWSYGAILCLNCAPWLLIFAVLSGASLAIVGIECHLGIGHDGPGAAALGPHRVRPGQSATSQRPSSARSFSPSRWVQRRWARWCSTSGPPPGDIGRDGHCHRRVHRHHSFTKERGQRVRPPPTIEVVSRLADVSPSDWNSGVDPNDPFTEHAFLSLLEEAECVGPEAGWVPMHLLVKREGEVVGRAPLYLKNNSKGEYTFELAKDAAHRAGIPYYPKLVSAVPFTPATGRRFRRSQSSDRHPATEAMPMKSTNAHSLHLLFAQETERPRLPPTRHWLVARPTSFTGTTRATRTSTIGSNRFGRSTGRWSVMSVAHRQTRAPPSTCGGVKSLQRAVADDGSLYLTRFAASTRASPHEPSLLRCSPTRGLPTARWSSPLPGHGRGGRGLALLSARLPPAWTPPGMPACTSLFTLSSATTHLIQACIDHGWTHFRKLLHKACTSSSVA